MTEIIASLPKFGRAAEVRAASFNQKDNSVEVVELVEKVHERLGWMEKFLSQHNFGGSISLPPIGTFAGVGDAARWYTK